MNTSYPDIRAAATPRATTEVPIQIASGEPVELETQVDVIFPLNPEVSAVASRRDPFAVTFSDRPYVNGVLDCVEPTSRFGKTTRCQRPVRRESPSVLFPNDGSPSSHGTLGHAVVDTAGR
jgi:hypothetical protein